MPVTLSPLRYPGGKSQLTPLVIDVLRENDLFYGHYIEPFAGGAGIACKLLLDGYVSHIHLNDLDPAIYSFWNAVLTDTERFCEKIEKTEVSMKEWKRQKLVQSSESSCSFELGFSTFFLNRTNHSGIVRGGVIGGQEQAGKYRLDCRFNKADLIGKIRRLASKADQITLTNLDARVFLRSLNRRTLSQALVNIDPPYFVKGPELYRNSYLPKDHAALAKTIANINPLWMVTYDSTPETRAFYAKYPCFTHALNYSAQVKRIGIELLVLDPRMTIPRSLQLRNKAA